ncbi:hypothetical protein CEXT_562881 [Caerostris extrusa]|uniref:Uncharacterized protein n=1 Tax=Caerostris extrusa TaxID=172846 RepID=A0AAV4WPX1_CAEEX|nr:hypothetical protein CEXT_562881 [Caerostris extrusa]
MRNLKPNDSASIHNNQIRCVEPCMGIQRQRSPRIGFLRSPSPLVRQPRTGPPVALINGMRLTLSGVPEGSTRRTSKSRRIKGFIKVWLTYGKLFDKREREGRFLCGESLQSPSSICPSAVEPGPPVALINGMRPTLSGIPEGTPEGYQSLAESKDFIKFG